MWSTQPGPWVHASRITIRTPVLRFRSRQPGMAAPFSFALNRVMNNHAFGIRLFSSLSRFFSTLPSPPKKTDAVLGGLRFRLHSRCSWAENAFLKSSRPQSTQHRTLQGTAHGNQGPLLAQDPKPASQQQLQQQRHHLQDRGAKPNTGLSLTLLALGCALASGTLSYHSETLRESWRASYIYDTLKDYWNASKHSPAQTEQLEDTAAWTDGPGPLVERRVQGEASLHTKGGNPQVDDLVDSQKNDAPQVDLDGLEGQKRASEGHTSYMSTSEIESDLNITPQKIALDSTGVSNGQHTRFANETEAESSKENFSPDSLKGDLTTFGVSASLPSSMVVGNGTLEEPTSRKCTGDKELTENRCEVEANGGSLSEEIVVPTNTVGAAVTGFKLETIPTKDEHQGAELAGTEASHMQPAFHAEAPQKLPETHARKVLDTELKRCASASELLEFMKSIMEENLQWRLQEAHREWNESLDAVKREARKEGFHHGREEGQRKAAKLQRILDHQLQQTVERMRRIFATLQDTERVVKGKNRDIVSSVEKSQRLRILVLLHQRLMLGLPIGNLLEQCKEWRNPAGDAPDYFIGTILDSIPQRFQKKIFSKPSLSQGHLQHMLEGLSADAFQACFIGDSVGLLAHARALLQRAVYNATGCILPVALWERFKTGVFSQAAAFGLVEERPQNYAALKPKSLDAIRTSENIQLVQQALVCSRNGQFYEAYSLLKAAPPLLHGVVRNTELWQLGARSVTLQMDSAEVLCITQKVPSSFSLL